VTTWLVNNSRNIFRCWKACDVCENRVVMCSPKSCAHSIVSNVTYESCPTHKSI
jgi:hypothetical protein